MLLLLSTSVPVIDASYEIHTTETYNVSVGIYSLATNIATQEGNDMSYTYAEVKKNKSDNAENYIYSTVNKNNETVTSS